MRVQDEMNSPPPARTRVGEGSGVGGRAAFTEATVPPIDPPPPTPLRRFAEGGEKRRLMVRSAAMLRVSNHEAIGYAVMNPFSGKRASTTAS